MFYSSIWDGLLKLLTVAIGVSISIMVPRAIGFRERIDQVSGAEFWVLGSGVIVGVVVLFIGLAWLYYSKVSVLASWLHARFSLGAPVSIADAAELRTLFQSDASFTWQPMNEIRGLPKEERREALMEALARNGPDRRRRLL